MGGNSQDVMFVDFMSVAFPTSDVEPCDKMTQLIDDADDDSMDDDYADDDADDDSMDDDADEVEVLFLSNPNPIFDIMQSFLSSFSRPIPPSSDAIPISSPPRPAFRMLQSRDEFDDMMIGFGMDGDMCLLDNYNHLSSSCQASLDQLQMEIDEYDFDDGDGCPLVPIILFCLVMMLVLRCLARRRMAKRMDTLQTTLTAIHANPELKEKVEAASGVPLPPPLPKCRIAEKPWYVKVCCLLGVMAAVVVSAVSGLVITHAILSSGEDEDDNVEVSQSPIVVFLVLFVVVWAQFLVVVGILKAISAYRNASSAPVTASTGTSNNSSNNQSSGGNYPQVLQRMRSIQISSLLPRFGRPSSSSQRPEYEPLLSSDENDESTSTEMVDASAPPAVTHIPVVVTPVQYVSPNVQSSISML
jgi:fumarate reductase subunit C